MEITSRCNLGCVHCYISNTGDAKRDLSLTEIKSIVDQLTEEGCLWLLITGGEPLLRPDFQEIYTYVKKRGIMPLLFTNGTLITDGIADLLASIPPYSVEVSIYGSTEKIFEAVTRVPGSFRMCMEGIRRLLRRGIRLHLKTMAMTLNVDDIPAMKSLSEELGVPFRFDPENLTEIINRTLFSAEYAADRDGNVYLAPLSTEDYIVRVFDRDGNLTLEFQREMDKVEKSEEEIAEEKRWMEAWLTSIGDRGVLIDYNPNP